MTINEIKAQLHSEADEIRFEIAAKARSLQGDLSALREALNQNTLPRVP